MASRLSIARDEPTSARRAGQTAAICVAVGTASLFLPTNIQDALKSAAIDALRPGHMLVETATSVPPEANRSSDSDVAADSDRVHQLELNLRRAELRQARLHEELEATRRNGVAPFVPQSSSPLLLRDLIEARVLGRERDLNKHSALLVDLGTAGGSTREAFVVYGAEPVIDQGTDSGIKTGQPVYAGRCVLGRVTRAGRWTSAVQLVTDKNYSGRAQLLRETQEGVRFGAEGILRGLGNGQCELTGLPYTESVNVGDSVYTGGRSTRFPSPMYYGRVVEAVLETGQRWRIVVQPHLNPDSIRTVAVLRESMNTTRVLGQ